MVTQAPRSTSALNPNYSTPAYRTLDDQQKDAGDDSKRQALNSHLNYVHSSAMTLLWYVR